MKKSNLLHFVIYVMMSLTIFLCWLQLRKFTDFVNSCNGTLEFQKTIEELDKRYYPLILRSNGNKLKCEFFDINKEKGITTNQITKNNEVTLIIRNTIFNCQTCRNKQLSLIKETIPLDKLNKVILLTSLTNNTKDVMLLKRVNQLELLTYETNLNITPIDSLNIPYFFCINKDGIIFNTHILREEDDARTKIYLNAIRKRL
jgi:hypothetical protein